MKKINKNNDVEVLIYSKWCVQCEHPEYLLAINVWALHNDLDVKVVRTAYRPKDHRRATELWAAKMGLDLGNKDDNEKAQGYPIFVVHNDVVEIKEFIEMITDCKNKMVKGGQTKDDVQGLPKAKRSSRAHSVDRAVSKAKKKVEE